jgi:chemotaxis protein methyltransferase CheR
MKRRLDALIQKNGFQGYYDFFEGLKTNEDLLKEFIEYITINVTEFFRNPEQWTILEKEIIPRLLEKRMFKIWSAACSTGEEPYSIALILSKYLPLTSFRILATDIDKSAIDKAKEGIYNVKNVANVPEALLKKYFIQKNDMYMINEDIKNCVEFKQHNLLQDSFFDNCDLILCRNVLIYFTEESKTAIYQKFNNSLKQDGILFVGSTEQIILSGRYNFKAIKTFFYQKQTNQNTKEEQNACKFKRNFSI